MMPKPSAVMYSRGTFFSLLATSASGMWPMVHLYGFEALRTIVEFDLSELQAIEPPRGFGRD